MQNEIKKILNTLETICDESGIPSKNTEEDHLVVFYSKYTIHIGLIPDLNLFLFNTLLNLQCQEKHLEFIKNILAKMNGAVLFGSFILYDNNQLAYKLSIPFFGKPSFDENTLKNILSIVIYTLNLFCPYLEKIVLNDEFVDFSPDSFYRDAQKQAKEKI